MPETVKDEYGLTWWNAGLYVPACDELAVSGGDWAEYLSPCLLALDSDDNYCLVRVRETRLGNDSESYYDWMRLSDGEPVNVYFWQFLPAKPSYYTQLHSRNQMEADDERDNE